MLPQQMDADNSSLSEGKARFLKQWWTDLQEVGGGGGNTINRMIELNVVISILTFKIYVNRMQHQAPTGDESTRGLGADKMKSVRPLQWKHWSGTGHNQGADMVFITAGMGGEYRLETNAPVIGPRKASIDSGHNASSGENIEEMRKKESKNSKNVDTLSWSNDNLLGVIDKQHHDRNPQFMMFCIRDPEISDLITRDKMVNLGLLSEQWWKIRVRHKAPVFWEKTASRTVTFWSSLSDSRTTRNPDQ